jgi:predicted Ser/Thr protein kinase
MNLRRILLVPMATELAGQRGRYVLETEIGQGGVGTVFRARALDTGARVAVKVLHAGPDAETRLRFEQEARLGETFNHVNVVRVLDHGRHEGKDFLVMELVEGETLAALSERGAVRIDDAVSIVRELALAIEALHRHGIVHRDVKPQNIIIDATGRAILTDFGFAKDLNASYALTGEYVVGTPWYMSPEHARGVVAPSVDVYSLGVVLYELVTRRLPLKGADLKAQWRILAEVPPTPPRKIAPAIPRPLEAVILRALEKNPERRFRSAIALAEALDALGPAGHGTSFLERRSGAELTALAVAPALLLLGAAVAWIGLHAAPRDGRSAPDPPATATASTPPRAVAATLPKDESLSEEESADKADAALRELRVRAALDLLEPAARKSPRSPRLLRVLARALRAAGRAGEALEREEQCRALAPSLGSVFDDEARSELKEAPRSPEPPGAGWSPLPAAWEMLLGGSWGAKGDELLGAGSGVGVFELAALVRTDAPAASRYRVSVEVALESGTPGPYAGILFAAKGPDDFYAVYVFNDRPQMEQALTPDEIAGFQRAKGVYPKALRLARIEGGHWDIREQGVIAFPDDGFGTLEVEVVGDRKVSVNVNGRKLETTLDASLDGRVGLLKWYDTAVRFRGWHYDPR